MTCRLLALLLVVVLVVHAKEPQHEDPPATWSGDSDNSEEHPSSSAGSPPVKPDGAKCVRLQDGSSSLPGTYYSVPLSGPSYKVKSFENWKSAGNNFGMYRHHRWDQGLVVDGDLWMLPTDAPKTGVMKVDTLTGDMTQHTKWPLNMNTTTTSGFSGLVYDGAKFWLVPSEGNVVIRLDPGTGKMTGFDNFPSWDESKSQDHPTDPLFSGGTYDDKLGYVWMTGYKVPYFARLDPKDGKMVSFANWPVGYDWTRGAFVGATFDGTSVWAVPNKRTSVIGVNTADGTMQQFQVTSPMQNGQYYNLPCVSGISISSGGLFLVPRASNNWLGIANPLTYLNTTTGETLFYSAWPKDVLGSSWPGSPVTPGMTVAIYDGQYLWMMPQYGNMVIRFDTRSGTMKGFSFSTGITSTTSTANTFNTIAFDPATRSLWFIPYREKMILRLTEDGDTNEVDHSDLISNPVQCNPDDNYATPPPAWQAPGDAKKEDAKKKSKTIIIAVVVSLVGVGALVCAVVMAVVIRKNKKEKEAQEVYSRVN